MSIPFTDSDILGKYNEPVGVTAMSRMSELDMDRQTINAMSPQEAAEHRAAMAVYELMSATKALSELAATKTNAPLVQREANDIELAYTRLGRMLSHIRGQHAA